MRVLAWLPFLAALLVAFAAGVAFARLNQGWVGSAEPSGRRRFLGWLYGDRADIAFVSALVALLLSTLFAWLIAAAVLLRFVL